MRPFLLITAAAVCWLAPSYAPAQVYGGDPNALVDSWYRTYLGRPADAGMVLWVSQLQQGYPPDAVIAGILASDEFYLRGGGTPPGFISLLYNDILRRPANPGEIDYWVRRLYTESRQDVAHEILTQNPGVWVNSTPTVQPVVPFVQRVPGVAIGAREHWERDRHVDWDHHHDIHDYRRPIYLYGHGEHRDEYRR